MASNLPVVTYAPLIPGATSIDQKTIRFWVQVAIGAGVYAVGGIPAGLNVFVGTYTVDDTTFLWGEFESELTIPYNGVFYTYRYIPSTDKIQIFQTPVTGGEQESASPGINTSELSASAIIPAGVLNDVIVASFVYNRL
jgi:hypothetical protein